MADECPDGCIVSMPQGPGWSSGAERLVWKQGPSPRRAREDRQEQRAAFNPTANGMLECPLQAPRARLSPAKGEASVADISRHEYIDVALILHRGDVRPAAGVSS